MARALDIGFAAMCLAIAAVVLVGFLDQLPAESGTTTSTQAPMTCAQQVMLPLAATSTVALFAGAALVFRHLRDDGNQRLSELITFILCASAGMLQYVIFSQPAAVGVISVDIGARVRALGVAAARMLPAAATVTFSLGVALVLVHVGTGGRGGEGWMLSKMALEAAAVLVGLMAMALYTTC